MKILVFMVLITCSFVISAQDFTFDITHYPVENNSYDLMPGHLNESDMDFIIISIGFSNITT